jgi:hypothetical protein
VAPKIFGNAVSVDYVAGLEKALWDFPRAQIMDQVTTSFPPRRLNVTGGTTLGPKASRALSLMLLKT